MDCWCHIESEKIREKGWGKVTLEWVDVCAMEIDHVGGSKGLTDWRRMFWQHLAFHRESTVRRWNYMLTTYNFWQRHFITQMQSDILTCCKNPLNIVRFMSNMIAHIKRMFQQILEHFMVERIQFRCCVLHKPIFVLMWIERILRRCTANHNW